MNRPPVARAADRREMRSCPNRQGRARKRIGCTGEKCIRWSAGRAFGLRRGTAREHP